jgi:hypothetical protein
MTTATRTESTNAAINRLARRAEDAEADRDEAREESARRADTIIALKIQIKDLYAERDAERAELAMIRDAEAAAAAELDAWMDAEQAAAELAPPFGTVDRTLTPLDDLAELGAPDLAPELATVRAELAAALERIAGLKAANAQLRSWYQPANAAEAARIGAPKKLLDPADVAPAPTAAPAVAAELVSVMAANERKTPRRKPAPKPAPRQSVPAFAYHV